jgi:hypothetical protein
MGRELLMFCLSVDYFSEYKDTNTPLRVAQRAEYLFW